MMIVGSLKKWSDPYLRASENSKEIFVYLIADVDTVLDYLDILNILPLPNYVSFFVSVPQV
jgi:hypothetical protein